MTTTFALACIFAPVAFIACGFAMVIVADAMAERRSTRHRAAIRAAVDAGDNDKLHRLLNGSK